MNQELIEHLSKESVNPQFKNLVQLVEGAPVLVILQRYEFDLKTIKNYVLGTFCQGNIINERSGEGNPILLEDELEFAVFFMYSLPLFFGKN